MTQGERVREIRKSLGLTLEKFAQPLGVGKTAISKIEKNQVNLTEQMAKSICREFNVNYYWLTQEKGDHFTSTPESVIDEIAEEYNLDDIDKKIIERYLELSDNQRQVIKEYIKSIFE
ncbi:MAG: XRE family transcriptional regulator [Ruminococcus sp.]|jgi:transcriptional regulator with XRE-family HTH domain|nr:XRE family transcriptional regulator [Ruminococcus sp.]